MKKTVAILHQGFIPLYRAGFFRTLNQVSDKKYLVYHGSPPSDTGHREYLGNPDFPNVRIKNIEFSVFGKRIVYQPVIMDILRSSFDAVVLGHEVRFISNVVLFGLCKVIRRPVVWWGQGFEKEQISNLSGRICSRLARSIKQVLARLGDMYIVYTGGGAAKLTQAGMPHDKIRVVRNTIDMEEQLSLHADLAGADTIQLRERLNLRPDSKLLLYVGRVYKEKKVDELLSLVKRLNEERLCRSFVEAAVIGDGPELETVRAMGSGIEGVHFLGEIYDPRTVAQYLRLASAVVIPGKVGLAVNHAFSQGVPVITREHNYHAPEVEYIVHGQNGLIIRGDFDNFVNTTANFLNSPECEASMVEGALLTRESLTLEYMVNAFDEAVTIAIKQKQKRVNRRTPRADGQ